MRLLIIAGLLALATAMGIGRFAFTPLLPMMLHDGVVDLGGASWLAMARALRGPDREQAMSAFEAELDQLIANDSEAYQQ